MKYTYYKKRFDTIFAPGIKIFSNGLPLKADTYQNCSNFCRYCYSHELRNATLGRNGVAQNLQVARLLDSKGLIRFVERSLQNKDGRTPFMCWALRNRYYIEIGTTGETFQECDMDFKVTYNFMKLMSLCKIPLFINTKLNLICKNDEYFKLLSEYQAPIIICLSLITENDKMGKLYDPLAPLPSERLKTIKELNKYSHIKTIVYISPFLPGVTNKNTREYVDALLNSGIIGGHLRNCFMQGKTFQNSFWSKYKGENNKSLESFPGGHHVKYEVMKEFLIEAQEYARKTNPNFTIVGMKSHWFDLDACHGKMDYNVLPSSFKDGIVDFTAIPIMNKIRENLDKPQLLLWSKIGYKKEKINLPNIIRTNESNTNNLTEGICNCNTADIDYEVSGYDWLKIGMWNGWNDGKPNGFISTVEYIFPVKKGDDFLKENNDYVFVYLPKKCQHLLRDNGQTILFQRKSFDKSNNLCINEKDTKGFFIPEREGGTKDKWQTINPN